jgi:hypothetical protein
MQINEFHITLKENKSIMNKLLIVGTVAFDAIETPLVKQIKF